MSRFKKIVVEATEPSIPNGSCRVPTVEVCGHKPFGQFICNYPRGHEGPCGVFEAPEVDGSIERRKVTTCPVTFEFDKQTLPEELTDILYAWKKIGNIWATSLEAQGHVFSKGLKFQNKIDNPYALGCLFYLGYIESQVRVERMPIKRYRLSKKGLEATAEIARRIGDTQLDIPQESNEVDCGVCEGSGYDDNIGEMCKKCKGLGTIKTGTTQHQKNTAKPIVSASRPRFRRTVEVDCSLCGGSGVNHRGSKCVKCAGTGTVKE